ncbi:hypothetical protein HanRHA438_Chr08g0334451 [Helianthus annuus]|nr:hypothetical protein HanHA300_Chr08g0267211 [Helianthus annuus]KAJ0552322.1 hypothetical protein HanHA89_Chr08g0283981 [Helianthus annuus]KAJ0718021.1 hypothetical protein HanLR1_Chr08g0266061 [Helianthus annuus]KAJ0721260.1 hypothetical protein HanOQP8_Chr08g0273611 [Helianthus annuus]KAJ0896416.1 hypothetical protein HanRHA438_Chr08g0334451 [Helianthus annuus]
MLTVALTWRGILQGLASSTSCSLKQLKQNININQPLSYQNKNKESPYWNQNLHPDISYTQTTFQTHKHLHDP